MTAVITPATPDVDTVEVRQLRDDLARAEAKLAAVRWLIDGADPHAGPGLVAVLLGHIGLCAGGGHCDGGFRRLIPPVHVYRWAARQAAFVADVRAALAGRDLACWCPLDGGPCHADVLLELANGGSRG